MARMRTLKPGFFTSLDIADLRRDTRLHFAGLWTYADDEGRGVDDARLLKAAIWPLDDDITADDIERMQDELAKHDRIVRYNVAGRMHFQVNRWHDHQKPNRPQESTLPAPSDGEPVPACEPSRAAQGSFTDPSLPEGRGRGEVGEGEASPRKRSDRATRLPEDWRPEPEPELVEAIGGQGAAAREFDKFRDYWRGKAGKDGRKLDWQGTWRNWLRRAGDDRGGGKNGGAMSLLANGQEIPL